MKYLHIFLIAISLLVMSSCKKDYFSISGTIANGAGKTAYIEELTPDGPLFLDSISIDENGEFSFSYQMPYPTFYNLHITTSNYVMLLPEVGEKIILTGDFNNLQGTYDVRGSHGSMLLWQLQAYSNMGDEKLAEIIALDQENQQRYGLDTKDYREAKKNTDSLYFEAYSEQSDFVKSFIEQNKGSLATLIALYKPFGPNHSLIDIKRDPSMLSFYDMVLDGLKESLPDNPHTIHFGNSVAHLHHQYEQYQQSQQAQITVGQ